MNILGNIKNKLIIINKRNGRNPCLSRSRGPYHEYLEGYRDIQYYCTLKYIEKYVT